VSSQAISWVVRKGMQGLPRRLIPVLVVVAEATGDYGEGARVPVNDQKVKGEPLPRPGIATKCGLKERAVREHLAELEHRGVIARGDQRLVDFLPVNRRPVVWDIPAVRAEQIALSSGVFRG
jgi:hypothetical protein